MKLLFTYLPALGLLLLLLILENLILKWTAIVAGAVLIAAAKWQRSKMKEEEIEYDDRVNGNITKWSLRTLFVMNALLLAMLALDNWGTVPVELSSDTLFVYVLISLFVPFYIIPAIVKRF
ncbi:MULTISPECIES: hypothetical protein [Bhargavaea]|uniref:SdpI/YhfL protein family protein n=1 Tax=Bhargavaea changchunensis TaxID=2134037 RepID=A0ABW2NNF7_9BACL|nr:hypothetical protein [Bhargavaea sp. CC-171006]